MVDRAGALDQIACDFNIPNLKELDTAVWRATSAFFEHGSGTPDFRKRDTLDRLAELLAEGVDLLREPLNANRLATHWRAILDDAQTQEFGHMADVPIGGVLDPGLAILDICDLLDKVRLGAEGAHRERQQQSGPLPKMDIRAAIDVLVRYWKSLGRNFTHDLWVPGESEPEPVTYGERFVFACLHIFAPERAIELRSIARTFRG